MWLVCHIRPCNFTVSMFMIESAIPSILSLTIIHNREIKFPTVLIYWMPTNDSFSFPFFVKDSESRIYEVIIRTIRIGHENPTRPQSFKIVLYVCMKMKALEFFSSKKVRNQGIFDVWKIIIIWFYSEPIFLTSIGAFTFVNICPRQGFKTRIFLILILLLDKNPYYLGHTIWANYLDQYYTNLVSKIRIYWFVSLVLGRFWRLDSKTKSKSGLFKTFPILGIFLNYRKQHFHFNCICILFKMICLSHLFTLSIGLFHLAVS